VVTIAVELLTARKGLGAMIWAAWETMRIEELYAAIVVTAAIGVGANTLLRYVTNALLPWQVRQEV
jgi:NitT/TauT family transport system permease protein